MNIKYLCNLFALILICNAKIVRGLKLQYGSVNLRQPAVPPETGKSSQSELQFFSSDIISNLLVMYIILFHNTRSQSSKWLIVSPSWDNPLQQYDLQKCERSCQGKDQHVNCCWFCTLPLSEMDNQHPRYLQKGDIDFEDLNL